MRSSGGVVLKLFWLACMLGAAYIPRMANAAHSNTIATPSSSLLDGTHSSSMSNTHSRLLRLTRPYTIQASTTPSLPTTLTSSSSSSSSLVSSAPASSPAHTGGFRVQGEDPTSFLTGFSREFWMSVAAFAVILLFFGGLWYSWFWLRRHFCNVRNFRLLQARSTAHFRRVKRACGCADAAAGAAANQGLTVDFVAKYRRLR